MAVKIKTVLPRVKALLEQDRLLADNDSRLITLMWREDLIKKGINLSTLNVLDFFNFYENGILTSAESVRRNRQALEHAHPSLRGDTYELRHNIREKEIKAEIRTETFREIVQDKYTQIDEEILKTLKAGDSIYFTTPDTTLGCISLNPYEGDLIVGKKYIIIDTNVIGLKINTERCAGYWVNYANFSILATK